MPARSIELRITVNDEVRVFSLKREDFEALLHTEGALQFPKRLIVRDTVPLPQDSHLHFLARLSNGEFFGSLTLIMSCEVFCTRIRRFPFIYQCAYLAQMLIGSQF